MTRESLIKKRILQFVAVFATSLLAIVYLETTGMISPKGMAWIVILLSIAGWMFLTVSFTAINRKFPSEHTQHSPLTESERKKIQRSIRKYQILMAAMMLLLIYAFWNSRGEPLLPRVTGSIGNLLITALFFMAYRAQKSKLERSNDNGSSPESAQGGATV